MPSSPAASTVHGQQPSRPRSTIQTRRHSSPQSPSTAAHQDPSQATTTVLVHRPCPMPTRHRVRHQHHDQPRIRHNGSTTATPALLKLTCFECSAPLTPGEPDCESPSSPAQPRSGSSGSLSWRSSSILPHC
ncbi:unnamed protein product [Pleuronectes platessa]|uniref:Uncharacterized protein n=1 Tax=Pleuronectes platessa TaxID=8262 RepID=A0A9N7YFE0_PLEPL|nr:unnamed protein product [Pleuronectes platessa]